MYTRIAFGATNILDHACLASVSWSRKRKPSKPQIFSSAFWRAIFLPSSALKFSGDAQADSPVTVNPFRSTSTQNVSSGRAVALLALGRSLWPD